MDKHRRKCSGELSFGGTELVKLLGTGGPVTLTGTKNRTTPPPKPTRRPAWLPTERPDGFQSPTEHPEKVINEQIRAFQIAVDTELVRTGARWRLCARANNASDPAT